MRHGDAEQRCRFLQKRRREDPFDQPEHRQANRGADYIEGQVHHGRPLGILVCPYGREHGCHTGTDVLPHDDGNRRPVGDSAGGSQRLEDAYGSGAGLDDRRQRRSRQHSQDRIAEQKEEVLEARHVPKPFHRPCHGLHAEHQCGESQQDHAGVLLLVVFQEQIEKDSYKSQNRRKGRGLQQPDEHIAAVDSGQAQKPRCHRSTDIGSHDDMDGLLQRHQAGIHEAHYHHRGSRRALNHRRDAEPRQKASGFVGGKSA